VAELPLLKSVVVDVVGEDLQLQTVIIVRNNNDTETIVVIFRTFLPRGDACLPYLHSL